MRRELLLGVFAVLGSVAAGGDAPPQSVSVEASDSGKSPASGEEVSATRPLLATEEAKKPDLGRLQARPTTTVSFQQSVNGYKGTVDTEIWALAVNTILTTNPNASSDANNDGGESQVVMRFDEIIGGGPNRVPKHATVKSAQLRVSAFDQGTTVNLHRMLVPFDEASTWSSLVSGVSADGMEASRHKDSFTFGKIAANSSEIIFDVTDTVQAWVNGEDNHGWVFINTGGNGWDFYSSDFSNPSQHPKLVVEFTANP